jgi:thymidylate synthase (FAD)
MPLLFYRPELENFALQSRSNRQGRGDAAPREVWEAAVTRWERLRADASSAYSWLLEEDVARELARIDLPLSTYTQWYWKIDLHNLLHFLSLRVDTHAQWEIREFAVVMAGIVKRVAPLSFEAWFDYDLGGSPLSRGELNALRTLLESSEDGGVRVRPGASGVGPDALAAGGLSAREIEEFRHKLEARTLPDFDLDLSKMRSAEVVAAQMEEAVPGTFE